VTLLFWFSALAIVFAYAGYPAYLYVRALCRPRLPLRADIVPSVTIVLALHNEEGNLLHKLANLDTLDYPAESLEIIAVSDGSTDRTNQLLREWQGPSKRAVLLPEHCGKASAVNRGVAAASGEIVCFMDARQTIAADGLKTLVSNFADDTVGCVSGELVLRAGPGSSSPGPGLYWRMEKKIRNWEALTGSTVGATGAFYAIRRALLRPLPEGTVLDDVYIPLQVARLGQRVAFDPRAIAWEEPHPVVKEFRRKVRTLTGNYQLVQLAPWVLTKSNPLRFRLICHKLLRLIVPFALLGILVSSFCLRHAGYGPVFSLQIALYTVAAASVLPVRLGFLSVLANVSLTFISWNTAAVLALVHFVRGKKIAWAR
jgi:poly-beta-1,6-N-acetyl-D-glucosamine synthase